MAKTFAPSLSENISGMVQILNLFGDFAKQVETIVAAKRPVKPVAEVEKDKVNEIDGKEEEFAVQHSVISKIEKIKNLANLVSQKMSDVSETETDVKTQPQSEFGQKLKDVVTKK
jgi:hypothetical protein